MVNPYTPITPVDVTPSITASWEDVDLSAHIPQGSTGGLFHVVNTLDSGRYVGVRINGSTLTVTPFVRIVAVAGDPFFQFITSGVDENRICEVYASHDDFSVYLVGYFGDGVTFLSDGVDKSIATTDSYVDVDVSGDGVVEGATGAIILNYNSNDKSIYQTALRKKGSVIDPYWRKHYYVGSYDFVGLDNNRIYQAKISNTAIKHYLIGYVESPFTLLDDVIDKTPIDTGQWEDIDVSSDVSLVAPVGIFVLQGHAAENHKTGIKSKSYGEEYTGHNRSSFQFVAITLNSGKKVEGEGYITTDADDKIWLVGYLEGEIPAPILTATQENDDIKLEWTYE